MWPHSSEERARRGIRARDGEPATTLTDGEPERAIVTPPSVPPAADAVDLTVRVFDSEVGTTGNAVQDAVQALRASVRHPHTRADPAATLDAGEAKLLCDVGRHEVTVRWRQ